MGPEPPSRITLISSGLVTLDSVCTGNENPECHDHAHQRGSALKPIRTHHPPKAAAFNPHNGRFGILHWSIPIDELIFCYCKAMYIDLEITNKSKSIYLGPRNARSLVCR